MTILRLIPSVIAFLLIAAHFFRSGNLELAVLSGTVPLLLLIRRRWILIVVQIAAYAAAAVWMNAILGLVRERMIMHRPYEKAVIILTAVALFTILAGWLLNSPSLRSRYRS